MWYSFRGAGHSEQGGAGLTAMCNTGSLKRDLASKRRKPFQAVSGEVIAYEGNEFDKIYVVLAGCAARYNVKDASVGTNVAPNEGDKNLMQTAYLTNNTKLFQFFTVHECIGGYEFVVGTDKWATSVFQRDATHLFWVAVEALNQMPAENLLIVKSNLLFEAIKQWYGMSFMLQEYHSKNFRAEKGTGTGKKYGGEGSYEDAKYLMCNALYKLYRSCGESHGDDKKMFLGTQDELAYFSGLETDAARNAIQALINHDKVITQKSNGQYLIDFAKVIPFLEKKNVVHTHNNGI